MNDMTSESVSSNQDFSAGSVASKPLWERSPQKFWSTHESLIALSIQEWQAADATLSLSKAVSRYVDGLPFDIPADVLLKITKMVIDIWGKRQAMSAIGA